MALASRTDGVSYPAVVVVGVWVKDETAVAKFAHSSVKKAMVTRARDHRCPESTCRLWEVWEV